MHAAYYDTCKLRKKLFPGFHINNKAANCG